MNDTVLRGSPTLPNVPKQESPKSQLKHPKTGTTVEDAVAKAIATTADLRSPQVSPIVHYLPKVQYDNVITTPFKASGPGLTPRKDISPKSNTPYSPKGNLHSISSSPRYRHSYKSYETEEEEVIVVVQSNGDGTYTPIKTPIASPRAPRSMFDGMTSEELFKAQFNMEAEVNRLVEANKSLGLQGVAPGDLPCDELKGYLDHIKDQIGQSEKWKWLDMAMDMIYSGISYAMEKCNIPMKAYFDKLKSKIVDYRQLLAADPQFSEVVDKVIPTITSSEKKSPWIIIGVLILQVVIGCIAAIIGSMKGKTGAMAGGMGAEFASDQLDGYMFGNKSILSVAWEMGSKVFGSSQPQRPAVDVQVDV